MLTSFCLASDPQRKMSVSHAGQFEKDWNRASRCSGQNSSRTYHPEATGVGGKVQSKNYTGWNANSYIHTTWWENILFNQSNVLIVLFGLCFVGNNSFRGGMLTLNAVVHTQIMLNGQFTQFCQLSRKTQKNSTNSFWLIINWSCMR